MENVIFSTFLHYLQKSSQSLRHLCPSAVAVVLQWDAAVAVQAGHDERMFLFLNYSPPRPLVASQDTIQRIVRPNPEQHPGPISHKTHSICIANRALEHARTTHARAHKE